MPTLNDVLAGSLAQAVQVQQIIDALKGTPNKGVPVALVSLNDQANYALTVQNDDPTNSRALLVLKSDGSTLLSADANGVTLGSPVNMPSGSVTSSMIADGTIATADLGNQSVTNAKLGTDTARLNLLTNGGFEIWQRGNGPFTANAAYAADRWSLGVGAGSTMSAAKDTTNQDTPSQSCLAMTYTHSATSYLIQPFAFAADAGLVNQLRGRTITFSVRVRTSTAGAVRASIFTSITGIHTAGTAHTGDGTYQTLTTSLAVPTNETNIQVEIQFSASCTAYLDNAMLVVGSVPADYAPLHPADDLARCLRYYEAMYGELQGYAGSTGPVSYGLSYKVQKAVVPTITKVGTWTVSNCAQPSMGTRAGTEAQGFYLATTVTAGGFFQFYPSAVGQYVTAEANP